MSDSVLFVVPEFYNLPEIKELCPTSIDPNLVDSLGLLQGEIPVEYTQAITNYQGNLRLHKALAHSQLSGLYEKFLDEGKVSLDTMASHVHQNSDLPHHIQRHTTFMFLLSENVYFYPASTRIGNEKWKLRSKQQTQSILTIIESIRTKDDSYVRFTKNARSLLEFYRAHADPLLGTLSASDQEVASKKLAETMTESDREYVHFIVDWVRSPKTVAANPYEVFAPALLKAIKFYNDLFFDKSLAIRFLIQIGMFKPWDNVYLLQDGNVAEQFFWTDRAKEADRKMDAYANAFLASKSPVQDNCESIRHDFGDLPVYTIDDPSAKEIDDGVSVEKIPGEDATWLHVHIADPTTYIAPDHELASLIQQKVQTLYLPERHFPMLPESLSSQKFSLGSTAQKNQNGSQFAMTFSSKIDSQGNLLDYMARPSLVKNVRKIFYDDLDTLLLKHTSVMNDGLFDTSTRFTHPLALSQNKYEQTLKAEYTEDLLELLRVSDLHNAARTRRGALFFGRPAPTVHLSEPLDLPALKYHFPQYASSLPPLSIGLENFQSSPARQMVAETMIMGGRIASMYARDNGIDILHRTQNWNPNASNEELKQRERLFELRDAQTGWIKYPDMLQFMHILPPASLSTTPGLGHLTMGISDGYTRATSPLRRYTDFIVHWQLKAHMLKKSPFFSQSDLSQLIPSLEIRAKRLDALQNQSIQFWVTSLLYRMSADNSQLYDMEWDCIINLPTMDVRTELGGNITVASGTLLDIGMRARIQDIKRQLQIGEIIKVRISKIEQLEGRITLTMV